MKAANFLLLSVFFMGILLPAEIEASRKAKACYGSAVLFLNSGDTLQNRVNHNTTRRNIRNAVHPGSDIGVNEPGVNLAHREPRFKAGAELADKVIKRAAAPGQNSFDVILKNGGASLAMFENKGYTFLENDTLLIADQIPLRLVVPDMATRYGSGSWVIQKNRTGGRVIGAGQVSDIVKLKSSPVKTGVILLEAEKMIPGAYRLIWQPDMKRSTANTAQAAEWEFCYTYLPAEAATIELMDIDWGDDLCSAPGSIPAGNGIQIEIIPSVSYHRLH